MEKTGCLKSYFIWFVFALIIIPIGTVHAQDSPNLPKRIYFATEAGYPDFISPQVHDIYQGTTKKYI